MSRGGRWRSGLLLTAAALGLYGMTLAAPVFFDDRAFALEAGFMRWPARVFWGVVFSRDYFLATGERTWQPLVTTFHWLAGPRPWLWRLAGILLHAFNAGLAGLAARRLSRSRRAAFTAAGLFLCFPLSSEAVFFSSFKGHLLAQASILALWLCWARADEMSGESAARWRRAALAVFGLGLIGKETAAVGAAVAFFHDLILRRRPLRDCARRIWPYAALLCFFLLWRFLILKPPPAALVSAGFRPLTALGWFLGRLTWPFPACLIANPPGLFNLAALAAAGGLAWFVRRRPLDLFLLAWILAALLPASLLAGQASHTLVADRHLYLASSAAAVWAAVRLCEPAGGALAAALLFAWGALCLRRNGEFRDLPALAESTAACGAVNPYAHEFLGLTLLGNGDFPGAMRSYGRAAELAPNAPGILNGLGICRAELGDSVGAEAAFRRAQALRPGPEVNDNLGLLLASQDRLNEAVSFFDLAIAAAPEWEKPYRHAAEALRRRDPRRAAQYERRAVLHVTK